MERLSEYIDGDLDPSARAALETHLSGCADCRSALADLQLVRERARSLRNAPAPADLWPRIAAAIATEPVLPLSGVLALEGKRPRGRFAFSLPELVAACLAIAIVSSGVTFALLRQGAPTRASAPPSAALSPESATPGRTSAPEPTRIAEREAQAPAHAILAERTGAATVAPDGTAETPHEEAIAELRKALAKERDRLDPATIRTLESNLAIIDLAIDQAKRALTADPANTYVKEHLADTIRRKVELLQRATMLASASSSEGSR
ncbi:MAG TPA: zf-HC2 domain-containing protein [Candidatus Limnocylindrales bacterium]|nr:zf-HC2 domain-containing protein [Candidatus Limnocylindrales bacterium]